MGVLTVVFGDEIIVLDLKRYDRTFVGTFFDLRRPAVGFISTGCVSNKTQTQDNRPR